jgi:hypothetical protein
VTAADPTKTVSPDNTPPWCKWHFTCDIPKFVHNQRYVLHAEIVDQYWKPHAYRNALLIYENHELVILSFDPEVDNILASMPWTMFNDAPTTPIVKVKSGTKPWLSLLWLHVSLLSAGKINLMDSLRQDWKSERGTALFELHLCDELVPPIQDKGDVRLLLTLMEDERVKRLATMPLFRVM